MISIEIPEVFGLSDQDVLKYLAAKLYEDGKLSMGKAAMLCRMEKRDFILILKDYDVSILDIEPAELKHDIDNA